MTRHLIYLSVPGLRPTDVVDRALAPTLHGWAAEGALAQLTPSFPCLTSPVQASTWTGVGPGQHGVIANGFYQRDRNAVELWVGRNDVIQGEQIWDVIASTGELTSAVWHAQNIKDAAADYIITPEPIHQPDGTTKLWCYSKPEGLYERVIDSVGHFPLQHYWGPLANIESTRWIIAAAEWLIERYDPSFHYIYIPHLDYAAQRFGPDSPQAKQSLCELDDLLAGFGDFVSNSRAGADAVFLVVSEYAMTDVSGVIYPNVVLREAGLLETRQSAEGEVIDFAKSRAFAVVDHQCAHLYIQDEYVDKVSSIFRGMEGIDGVYAGDERAAVGLTHTRSGEVILAARDDHWFAYYWWLDDNDAPAFARTVDIHRKPGYDPVELFIDPQTKTIPLDAELVKGSHGAPARASVQRGAVICSVPTSAVVGGARYRDTDVKNMVLDLLGVH